jgi:hypothetical protein
LSRRRATIALDDEQIDIPDPRPNVEMQQALDRGKQQDSRGTGPADGSPG